MNRDQWESSYRRAREQLRTPTPLETKILADIRAVKPAPGARRNASRLLTRVASGFSAVAIAVVLLHPAQYIGAAPGQLAPRQNAASDELDQYRPEPALIRAKADSWYALRTEVEAGNYLTLCAQWRQQQRTGAADTLPTLLPQDLIKEAHKHCRILP